MESIYTERQTVKSIIRKLRGEVKRKIVGVQHNSGLPKFPYKTKKLKNKAAKSTTKLNKLSPLAPKWRN